MKNRISRLFGRLFATKAYIATLSDEELAVKAFGKRDSERWFAKKAADDASVRESKRKLDDLIEARRGERPFGTTSPEAPATVH